MTGRFWAKKLRCRRSYYEIVNVLQQTQQRCHNRELEILAPIVLTPKKQNEIRKLRFKLARRDQSLIRRSVWRMLRERSDNPWYYVKVGGCLAQLDPD